MADIQKIDLQRARRYGMKEEAHNGREKYTYDGVGFIMSLRQKEKPGGHNFLVKRHSPCDVWHQSCKAGSPGLTAV
jgi:hypothetical protein